MVLSELQTQIPPTRSHPGFPCPIKSQLSSAGSVYIAERAAVRKVTGSVITTIVGGGTIYLDNVPATTSSAGRPGQLGFDAAGSLYFTDSFSHSVRKVDSSGIITTVAGTPGVSGTSGDGAAATAASLNAPHGLRVESNGDFLVGDRSGRVRKVTSGTIQTIAGTGVPGFNGDGPLLSTQLHSPAVLMRNSGGQLVVVDTGNAPLRRIDETASQQLSLSIGDVSISEGNSLSKLATFTVTLSAASASAVTYNIATRQRHRRFPVSITWPRACWASRFRPG